MIGVENEILLVHRYALVYFLGRPPLMLLKGKQKITTYDSTKRLLLKLLNSVAFMYALATPIGGCDFK